MILNAMMILGCWSGSVDLANKYMGDSVCEEYSLKIGFDEASRNLSVQKLGVSCPDEFDTTWSQLDFRVDGEGSLWVEPVRGDEKIVGWFRDGEFHAEDSLNSWMYQVWSAQYVSEGGEVLRGAEAEIEAKTTKTTARTTVETLRWEDRLIRIDETLWIVSGNLSRVSCSSL